MYKYKMEFLREHWNEQTYPFSMVGAMTKGVAENLGTQKPIIDHITGEIEEFLKRLTLTDYVEALTLNFSKSDGETHFQLVVTVSEPCDGWKKTSRQWFTYRLPSMNRGARQAIVSLLIDTFLNRPLYQGDALDNYKWHAGAHRDYNTHKPSDRSTLQRKMDNVIQEDGRVILQRLMLTLYSPVTQEYSNYTLHKRK